MKNISDEFISRESKQFKFKVGRAIASSLSGFIAGVIFASIIWLLTIFILRFL